MLEVLEVEMLEVFEVLKVSMLISSRKSLIFSSFSWSVIIRVTQKKKAQDKKINLYVYNHKQ